MATKRIASETNSTIGNATDTLATNSTEDGSVTSFLNVTGDLGQETADRETYMLTYAAIMAVGVSVYLYRSFAFFKLCLRVSINLHDKLFRGITRAKMLFYNSNPSGRILNRFARDINNVDSLLPMVLIDCTDVSFLFEFLFSVLRLRLFVHLNHY